MTLRGQSVRLSPRAVACLRNRPIGWITVSGTTPPPSQTAPALSSSVAPGIGGGPAGEVNHEEGGR